MLIPSPIPGLWKTVKITTVKCLKPGWPTLKLIIFQYIHTTIINPSVWPTHGWLTLALNNQCLVKTSKSKNGTENRMDLQSNTEIAISYLLKLSS